MSKYTILFVDDEERVLRSLNSLFRREYNVITASNGFEALRILSRQSVNVIVSDQRMPQMLGNELLAEVKRLYPNIMRLLLTGYMDKEAIVKTINEGEIYRFINKPWQVTDIKRIVAEAASVSTLQIKEQAITRSLQEPVRSLREPIPSYSTVAQKARKQHGPVPKKQRVASKDRASVLLMDPDQQIRNQVRRISYEQGFQVYGQQQLEQAVRTLALRPNIGVAIIGMPMDSRHTIEAINLLKQHRPALSIITLTDITDAAVAVELINRGQVFRYLQKPLRNVAFSNAIRSAMTRHQALSDNIKVQARFKVESFEGGSSFERFKSFFKVEVA